MERLAGTQMDMNELRRMLDESKKINDGKGYGDVNVEEPWEYIDLAQNFLEPELSSLNELGNGNKLIKSKTLSIMARNQGNKEYKKHFWREALKNFTQAIALADAKSEELAFAYANRSAALYAVGFYKECLEDLERAFSTIEYPVDKKQKLIERQKNAMEKLPSTKQFLYHEPVPEIKNKHPTIDASADSVKISKNDQYGRFVEATVDIEPGEIICVEKPYAFALDQQSRQFYCAGCSELCFNMIPCEGCIFNLYCSEACRKANYDEYHKLECIIMAHYPMHFSADESWAQLALKVTLKALKEFKNLKNEDSSVYRSDRYKEISELVCHLRTMAQQSVMEMCCPLAQLYNIIKKDTQFLQELEIDDKTLKTILVKNKIITSVNSLSIISCHWQGDEKINRGTALWSFFSMFNHSCVPNVGYSFYGSTVVGRALKQIPAGSQLFISYGSTYLEVPKDIRQLSLSMMSCFTCTCRACSEDWPTFMQMSCGEVKRPMNQTVFAQLSCKQFNMHSIDTRFRTIFREKMLKDIFELAEKIKDEEPSINYSLLNNAFNTYLLVGNMEFYL